jgi:DcuC family C4-dicarboxylate transporter
MSFAGPIIALVCIVIVARLLLKKYYPHAVLLAAGLLMLITAFSLGLDLPHLKRSTGFFGFDLFRYIKEAFVETNAGVGLLIMSIGGFVAYIDHIGASASLVKLAMRPLGMLKNYPHAAACAVIPIGQILFISIPSAAGLSLLLMASIFPILTNLGVSRLSAVSVITACTAIGLGPASAMSASAADIMQMPVIDYFVGSQFPLLIPLSIVITISYFFVNRYFDKKMPKEEKTKMVAEKEEDEASAAPKIYALIPILPIIILIFFSEFNSLLPLGISLDTTTAMFISLFIAMMFEWVRHKKLSVVFQSLKVFWSGMGNIFKTVVTLIIAADIFSQGLIALGFIDGLLYASQHIGLGVVGVAIVMTVLIFLSSMLMGSGNAAFFAFGPLVPDIATEFGIKSTFIILPMNFAASMGRTISPIAGVLIASAELADVTTFQIVKRNAIPIGMAMLVMLIYHFV